MFISNPNSDGIFSPILLFSVRSHYVDEKEYAVCNLASIALPKCVEMKNRHSIIPLIYTKDNCNWCKLAKLLLERNKMMYCEINVNDIHKKKELGIISFPHIVCDNNVIGGDRVFGIEANGFETVTFSFTAGEGDHVFKIKLDELGDISESDVSNNVIEQSFSVEAETSSNIILYVL